jgi:hypothetical protein
MSRPLFARLTDAAADEQGLRRTALFLHGLHPRDREILLDGVPGELRPRLAAMLRELGELGIQAADAVESLATWQDVQSPPPRPPASLTCGDELDADWLGRADAQWVSRVLAVEPDVLIARVLRVNAWAWKANVLACLEEERRRRVNELLLDPANRHREHGRLDAALLRHLRAEVQRRIDAAAPAVPARPRPRRGRLGRLLEGWQVRRAHRSAA